ncbi:MAG: hypothetical protein NTY80_03500 [candidate division SR1 bacterium]|nr:hypothetical protein [candidate division SR1 bacterium]
MKKILSILAIIVYIFSINTLVHASTMGAFSHINENKETDHCHAHEKGSQKKTQTMNCCEFAISNEYSNTQIQLEYTQYTTNAVPTLNYFIKDTYSPSTHKKYIAWSPGRNTDIKYNKFSDLFGIIVQLS